MSESGHTWQLAFKGEAIEAAHVRRWATDRAPHPDAAAVAHELFVAVLSSGSPVVTMTLSTAGTRTRITAEGTDVLPMLSRRGPGHAIVTGLTARSGVTTTEQGLWAQLETAS